jgi:hypothetical protein
VRDVSMLVIRTAQMSAFATLADKRLASRIVELERARAEVPWVPAAESMLRARIIDALARGRQWGLQWDLSLADFARLDLTYGSAFDAHPEVSAALDEVARDAQPDVRFFSLSSRVAPAVWASLADARDTLPTP